MNTVELLHLINQDTVLAQHFLGVYARDTLPSEVSKKPSALIVNTHPIHMKGEHWLAVYFDSWNKAEYFDSYGFEPLHNDIKTFIVKNCSSYLHNTVHLQDITSNVCGMYCVFYLFFKCRGYSMKNIQDMFTVNKTCNDSIVCKFIKSTFNYIHSVCETSQACVPYCDRLKNT